MFLAIIKLTDTGARVCINVKAESIPLAVQQVRRMRAGKAAFAFVRVYPVD